ncbi:PAS domain S-box protein, partial [Patescibacteria group bacterium]|nr:PAS domain S-box protein [Patescibacteria group bacterium]
MSTRISPHNMKNALPHLFEEVVREISTPLSKTPAKTENIIRLFSNPSLSKHFDSTKTSREKELIKVVGKKDADFLVKKLKPIEQDIVIRMEHSMKLAKAMGHAFWIGDKNHRTLYCDEIYRATTGYSLPECIGQASDFCFDKESKKTIEKHHQLRPKGFASSYEATYINKSGKKIPMLIVGTPNRFGGTYGVHINLTRTKQQAAKEKIAEQIVRNSAEAIIVLNKLGKIQLWSSGAARMFGYKEAETINKTIAQLIIPKDKQAEGKEILEEVSRKTYLKNIETKRQTASGDLIDVSMTITKVSTQSNRFVGYLVIYRDITNQKRVNSELQKRFETIQDAYKELGLQKRQIDYIYEISNAAASDESLKNLSNLIISALALLTKCDGAVLRLY